MEVATTPDGATNQVLFEVSPRFTLSGLVARLRVEGRHQLKSGLLGHDYSIGLEIGPT